MIAAVRRKAVERKECVPDVPKDVVILVMKKERKLIEVTPFMWR